MARPQVRGNQVAPGSISNVHIAADAAIESTKLAPLSASLDAAGNRIVNVGEPVAPQDVATKAYTDAVAQGLDIKASCRLATTGSVPLLWGEMVLDSVMAYAGDRVLVKNQTGSPETNGIYQVASAGTWSRTADASGTNVSSGMFTFISSGSLLADTGWVLTTDDPIVVDVTPLTFAQFSGAGVIVAGMGMVQNGQEFDVVSANSAIRVNPNDVEVVVAGAALDIVPGGGLRVTPGEDGQVLMSNAGTVALATAVNRVTVAEPFKVDSSGTAPGTGNVYVSFSGTSAVLNHVGLMEARSTADYFLNILGDWETNMLAGWVGRGGSYSITSSPDIQVTNGSHAFTPFAADGVYSVVGGITSRCYVYAHAAGTVTFELTAPAALILMPNLDYGVWLPYIINGNKGSNWPANIKVEFRRMDELTWNTAFDGATVPLMAGLWSGTLYQPPAPSSGYSPTLTGVRFTLTYTGTETHRISEIGVGNKHLIRHAYTAAWTGKANEFTRGQTIDTDALTEPALTILNNGTNVAVFKTDGTTVLNTLLDLSGPNQNVGVGESALVNNTGTENVAVGYQASQNSVASSHTTAVGAYALQANQGDHNTAVGHLSLTANGAGHSNVAVGADALMSCLTGSANVAVGRGAAVSLTTGYGNVAIGINALQSATNKNRNVAVGTNAMRYAQGDFSVAIGESALENTTNNGNIAIGASAARGNTSAGGNVAIGSSALYANTTGAENVVIGNTAAFAQSYVNRSVVIGNVAAISAAPSETVVIGYRACYSTSAAIYSSVVVGNRAMEHNTDSPNVALGYRAGHTLTAGAGNTLLGYGAGQGVGNGADNVVVGHEAQDSPAFAYRSVAVGVRAARYAESDGNTVVGYEALSNNPFNGTANVVVGQYAMQMSQTGDFNVAVGAYALNETANLTRCTAVGYRAGFEIEGGTESIIIGASAGGNPNPLLQSVVVGNYAGMNVYTGTNSILMGYLADVEPAGDYDSVTVIGANARTAASNTNVIGASGTNRVQNTTTIRGPLLVRKDAGEGPTDQVLNYSAGEVVLFGTNTDFTATGTQTIRVPDNSHFYPDEVGVVVTQFAGITTQPTVSFGTSGNSASLVLPVQTQDLSLSYGRERMTALRAYNGLTRLVAAVTTAGTGAGLVGRFYFKGILVED